MPNIIVGVPSNEFNCMHLLNIVECMHSAEYKIKFLEPILNIFKLRASPESQTRLVLGLQPGVRHCLKSDNVKLLQFLLKQGCKLRFKGRLTFLNPIYTNEVWKDRMSMVDFALYWKSTKMVGFLKSKGIICRYKSVEECLANIKGSNEETAAIYKRYYTMLPLMQLARQTIREKCKDSSTARLPELLKNYVKSEI